MELVIGIHAIGPVVGVRIGRRAAVQPAPRLAPSKSTRGTVRHAKGISQWPLGVQDELERQQLIVAFDAATMSGNGESFVDHELSREMNIGLGGLQTWIGQQLRFTVTEYRRSILPQPLTRITRFIRGILKPGGDPNQCVVV